MEVSNEILDFLTGIHGRSEQDNRKDKIFDRAFALAYKDMATHTVVYKYDAKEAFFGNNSKRCIDNKVKTRNAIKEYVVTEIFNDTAMQMFMRIDSQTEFDEWQKAACKAFSNIKYTVNGLENKDSCIQTRSISELLCQTDNGIKCVFTTGQAQKLINMMVKYLYIFYQCEGRDDLERLKQYAHVPIDSYVLKEVFGKETYNGTPWSKIESYETYQECEAKIIETAELDGFESPFLWELAKWPFEKQ